MTKTVVWMAIINRLACRILIGVFVLSWAEELKAEGDASFVCDQVAKVASQQTGVPISVLKAISLTETGRKRGGSFRPWPWTVNMEGKGVWFDTEEEARSYVFKHFKRGARSFDVGCFQINYKWHHKNFSSLDEMFDPLANGLYAARFLSDLFSEKGNWSDAAGAYHSRTPKYANRYKERFAKFRARLAVEDDQAIEVASYPATPVERPQSASPVSRINNFPLLQTGRGEKGLGSLVPIGGVTATPLFGAGKG
ncbi:lytic transglycosylase domain-containing protein [Aliiroseovarius sp. KMU-50]|uniref:Lytic transglycosylase domain-containing protein n=1 Tax=Aliiroseovarius salicola TaxID=3009082 RepID=A0ABT4VZ19_9RHOB|nr:lytic transglycosylase domain-containing protein [Aliiroseovarius sp. KMU-50]MDA5092822.1 lytic transglycosylase domain-containing protein [Aliiroseovarius sp. KMU-50]